MAVDISNESACARIFVKIKRIIKSNKDFDGIAVELYQPSKCYLDLVEDIKTAD